MSMNYTKIWNFKYNSDNDPLNIEQFIFNFPRYVMHSKSNVALMKHQIVFNFDKNIIVA